MSQTTVHKEDIRARPRERVVVAMSGGVDSSVAAALLSQEGYEVAGIMLRLWASEAPAEEACDPLADSSNGRIQHFVHNRCCTPDAVEDARRVCDLLDIPFYLLNAQQTFHQHVVEPFVSAYVAGQTPNPCLACNRHIRFGFLLRYARALGARYLATGHYARVQKEDDRYRLMRGIDAQKDQSYVLYMLGQEDLAHVLFPVGHFRKPAIRKLAHEFGLPVAEKGDSQDLCFVAGGDYRQLLSEQAPDALRPGPIFDQAGHRLGTHDGLPLYTIGQRRGLGLHTGHPLYVLRLNTQENSLIVGPPEALGRRDVAVAAVHYVAGQPPRGPVRVTAKLRYTAPAAPATLEPLAEGRARLIFDEAQRAVSPGQAAVFYDDDEVLGGGLISGGA